MMAQYWSEFLMLYWINLLNLISPGAGCALTVRNSTLYSRKIGLYTGFGIVTSSLIHKSYTFLGFGLLVSQTPWLFNLIKYAGAFYLCYLGIKPFLPHKKTTPASKPQEKDNADLESLSPGGAYRMGFFVDLLNPTASLSFVCIVALTVSPETPLEIRGIYGACLLMTSLAWYSLLAVCFSNPYLQNFLRGIQVWVDRVMGCFLIYLGVRLALMAAK